jgi:hypothetical protein
MIPDENARPWREARGGLEVESQRRLATTASSTQALSIASHQAARHALFAACVAVGLCAGRRPEEVAAEIARRALAALLAKREAGPEGAVE